MQLLWLTIVVTTGLWFIYLKLCDIHESLKDEREKSDV